MRVIPRAAHNVIQGVHGRELKIRLCAPPADGKANEALVRLLSEQSGVPRSRISILSGDAGRHKTVQVCGITRQEFIRRAQIQAERPAADQRTGADGGAEA